MNDLNESGLGPETETPPPLGIFSPDRPSMPESNDYDCRGNLKGPPVKTIEETHGENFIKIFVHEYCGDFYYSFQLKIEKVVRQKRANIADPALRGPEAARMAARNMIVDICKKNHAIKKVFADFTVIRYNQPELF